MDAKRPALSALVGVALLALLAHPVAAYDSTAEALIRDLNRKLLYVAIPITVLVELVLFYAVLRFRDNDDPTPTEENRRLEITWTVATAVILVFVGVASYGVMAQLIVVPGNQAATANLGPPDEAVSVTVVGQRWFWTFEYPRENVTTSETMVIPVDRPIYVRVTSSDWIHSVHVPELGLKQDAIPDRTNSLAFTATRTGDYQLYCAEYCGSGHSEMLGTVRVVSQDEYRRWLAQQGGGNETAGDGSRVDPVGSAVD